MSAPPGGQTQPIARGALDAPQSVVATSSVTIQTTAPPWVPSHVQNFTFWNQSGLATTVPVSWMAKWATWVETGQPTFAAQFHAAGGAHTVVYTSPNYFLVTPTFKQPGNYTESAFGHGASGARSQRQLYGGEEYYLLPNSAASQSGYQAYVDSLVAPGSYDYVFADGVSSWLGESTSLMTPLPVEITTDAQYVAGMKQLMALSPRPTIINGWENGNPLQEEEYVGATNIAGVLGEYCFTTWSQITLNPYWVEEANSLIYATSRGTYAFCGGRGAQTDNRAFRTYYLASWWLTYDPKYSVSLTEFTSNGTIYLFPEQLIVPTGPDETVSNVSALKWSTGVYVRRFERCYYNRVSWGYCAAVVNPSAATVAIPKLPVTYQHSLVLDDNNLYFGGTASLGTSVPTSLGPGSAVILFQ